MSYLLSVRRSLVIGFRAHPGNVGGSHLEILNYIWGSHRPGRYRWPWKKLLRGQLLDVAVRQVCCGDPSLRLPVRPKRAGNELEFSTLQDGIRGKGA